VDWVRVVCHARNLGLSQAIQTGFRTALDEAAPDDVIVTMDADNTHPTGLIPRMLGLLDEGHDVVIASRFRPGARMIGIPFHRRLFSLGVSAFFRIVQPVPGVRDFSSGYRAYRAGILRRAYSAYGDEFITEQGFACMVEILFKISRLRPVIIGEVPMILRYDLKPGPTKMNASRTIVETLRLALRHRFRPTRPRDAD
jgi:dolichol-phosphate mannosyltransferase